MQYSARMLVANSETRHQPMVITLSVSDERVLHSLYEAADVYIQSSRLQRCTPGVYEWNGSVRVQKNGELQFVGKWTKMDVYPGRLPATKPRQRLLCLSAALQGKKKYDPNYYVSDADYMEDNRFAVVRFLDTMNERRGK